MANSGSWDHPNYCHAEQQATEQKNPLLLENVHATSHRANRARPFSCPMQGLAIAPECISSASNTHGRKKFQNATQRTMTRASPHSDTGPAVTA